MDFDLNKILANLKPDMEIPKGFDFLQKYNKNHNSIFESDEIEDIRQAIIKSACADGLEDKLSEDEMIYFYNKSYEKGKQVPTTSLYSEPFNMVNNWLQNLLYGKSSIIEDMKNSDIYKNLSEKRLECVEIYVNNLMRTSDIDFNNYPIDAPIKALSIFTEEQINEILPIIKKLNEIPTVSLNDFISKYLESDGKFFKNISLERINYIVENQLYNGFRAQSETILDIITMEEDLFEKAKSFIELENIEEKPNKQILEKLVKIPKSYERIVNLINEGKINTISESCAKLLALDDKRFEKAINLLGKNFEKYGNATYNVCIFEAVKLSELNDEELENFKNIINSDIKITSFDPFEFAKMSKGKRERIIYLSNTLNRSKNKFGFNDLWQLSNVNEKSLDDFILSNPEFSIVRTGYSRNESPLKNISLQNGNKEYLFDYDKGLVEVKTTDYNADTKTIKIHLENSLSNKKQELIYENCENEYATGPNNLKRETMKFYDKKGNLLKTEIAERNDSLNRLPSYSVIYPNGERDIIQKTSFDPITKAISIEKHLTSPDGIKTDYYYKSTSDKTKIVDYKIADKKGNVLLQQHNTYQQISDNHVVTSTNGHKYDIYYEENSIKIIDSKNKDKTYIIDLKDIKFTVSNAEALSADEKALKKDYIKQCLMAIPGHLLLLMKNLPIKEIVYYNNHEQKNLGGNWDSENRILTICQITSSSISELETLKSVFLHEYGHFIDSTIDGTRFDVSQDPEIDSIYKEELEEFRKHSTSIEQKLMSHIINDSESEKAADTIRSLYEQEPSMTSSNLMLFQKYFSRTITATAKKYAQKEAMITQNII